MEQVIETTLLHGLMPRAEAEARAVVLFGKLGLPNPETFGNRYPHQVSGGQLQRAMTAMALCPKPDLVIFDEPTTALDVTTQIEVLAAIKEAIRDTGVAALYITHDLAVVAQVADDIMVLRHGKTVEYGPTDQIINRPRQDYTKALVSVRSIDHQEKPPAPAGPVGAEPDRALSRHAFRRAEGHHGGPGGGADAGGGGRKRIGQIHAGARDHRAAAADAGAGSPLPGAPVRGR